MTAREAGRRALDHIDAALARRPERDNPTLKLAVQALAAFRDGFVELHRAEGGTRWRPALSQVNAVISVVLAAEFPIGEAPWAELEKARAWLDEVLVDDARGAQ